MPSTFAPGGGLFVPLLIVAVAIAFVLAVRFISSRYKKIPPNAVGVFYGRKYKDFASGETQGFLVVSGGGRILYPLVEEYMEMSTSAFQIEIDETGIPNKDNVRLTVRGVASCQLSPTPEDLNRAAQSFLGKPPAAVELFIANILKGHLRSIIGKMNIDEILRERDKFNARVIEESSTELKRVGIDVINLVIQDVNDNQGYIDALGRQAVADAKAEAEIRVADANRRQIIAVSDANRESDLVRAGNEAKVAEANKERDIKKAAFLKETSTVQAEADMAGQIAKAAQEQRLKVAEAERDAAEREAQVKVQEKEGVRRTKELEATVVAQARADQQRAVIAAEGGKQKRVIDADAEAEYLKRTAQAKRDAATLEGEGEANRKRSVLLAEAEGKAAEKRQALLAEAEGTQKLAEALAQMSTDARFILVLDKLPNLLDHGGDALAKTLQAMFSSVAAGLGQIDRISIVDMGGSGQGVNRIAELVPQVVFNVLAQLKARGVDLSGLLQLLKIDGSGLESLLAGVEPGGGRSHAATARPAPPAATGVAVTATPTPEGAQEHGAK
jgi:flotillin